MAVVLPVSHKETNNNYKVLCIFSMPGAEWLITETDDFFFFLEQLWTYNKNSTYTRRVCKNSVYLFFKICWDFPGGSVVKNPASNEEGAGLILGWRSKIPYAMGQLSVPATTTEPENHTWQAYAPRLERSPRCNEVSCVPQLRPDAAINT